jgi:hypothetical protein
MTPLTVVGMCSFAPAVHRWLRTLRAHFDGPCLLYLTDPPAGVPAELAARYGVTVVPALNASHFWEPAATGMYCGQWECLLDACTKRVRQGLVLRTDVWDVVFQDDPRKFVATDEPRILIAREGPAIADEEDNRAWVRDWVGLFGSAPVVNSGLVCGPVRSLAVLAGLMRKAPLGTWIDQSEFELIVSAFGPAFEYRPGFLECMYQTFAARGEVRDGRVCDRETGRPWCVVHGNGAHVKELFDKLYPV